MKKLIAVAALAVTAAGGIAYAQQQPTPSATPHAERGMRADTNRDGVVTRDEFLAKAGERFAKVDSNGDGRIVAAERQAVRAKWREMRGKRRHRHHGSEAAPTTATPGA